MSKWTHFWDMSSGGGDKEDWSHIFIEAPREKAEIIFYNRFGHNPNRVTCTCCGPDYSINEEVSLEKATAWHRGCMYGYEDKAGNLIPKEKAWIPGKGVIKEVAKEGYLERPDPKQTYRSYQPLEEYLSSGDVLVIRAEEIKESERLGDLPEQGYVWV